MAIEEGALVIAVYGKGGIGKSTTSPLVGAGSRLIVAEGFPGIAMRALVLAHGAPLPFAQVWAPRSPRLLALVCLRQALVFRRGGF